MQHWLFESKMIVQADAFTHEQFSGNPAAVCLLDADVAKRLSNERLQQVAAEYQQPATAFLAVHDQDADFRTSTSFTLSWFTTTTELPLCGHGTIAAAAVLFQGLFSSTTQEGAQSVSGKSVYAACDVCLNICVLQNARISTQPYTSKLKKVLSLSQN